MGQPLRLHRRMLMLSAAGLLAPISLCARPGKDAAPPIRCADFLASIGVNTHIAYLGSQYEDVEPLTDALSYVGVKHVRDVAINALNPNVEHYAALASAGVNFCMFWGVKRTMANAIDEIAAFEAAYPGAVHALEGPNEIKASFAYAGLGGNAAGRAFMADMRRAARSNPALRDKPLVNFTGDPPCAADCDFANAHPYPKGGRQPGRPLQAARVQNVGPSGVMPGKPMVFTEFGYHTLVGKPAKAGAWQGVDPETQAVLLINGLLDNAAAGVTRTYIYQLFDAYPDSNPGVDQERHFGLFAVDGAAKPAANALKTLRVILAEEGANAARFPPSLLAAHVDVASPLSCLRLRNDAGRAFLAFWNETPIWDSGAARPIAVEPILAKVTLHRPAPMQAFDPFNPIGNKDFGVATSASVSVGAHPIVLRLG